MIAVRFTVLGKCASKANSRRLVMRGGVTRSIKSEAAMAFADAFEAQCPLVVPLISGPVCLHAAIFYPSRRQDLDESLVMDGLQGRVIVNDRQIVEKHCYRALDRERPRVEVAVVPLEIVKGQAEPAYTMEDYLLFAGDTQ